MTTLTQEQKQLLQQITGEPPRLLDPDTNREYVLLPAEIYQRLQAWQLPAYLLQNPLAPSRS